MKKMHHIRCKTRLSLAAMLLVAGMNVTAQSYSHRHTTTKSFPVTRESTLEVENKYGAILVVPWKKDSVKVSADIFLEAKSQSKLRKLRNDIGVSFSATKYYVLARTVVGDDNSKIASEIRALGNTLSNKSTVEVNYTVYIPEYIDLVLTNKFGDIFIDDINGSIDVSLSNGALKANTLTGNATIDLSFAKADIKKLNNSTVSLSYSELDVEQVEQMDLVSKSSELHSNKVGVLKVDSRRDKITVGQVEYLYGSTSFTDIRITDFIRESDCYMKYGKLTIENVWPDFSRIKLESDYTDISLFFDPESNYNVDILHSEKAVLTLPAKDAELNTQRSGDDFLATEGHVGNAASKKLLDIKAINKCYIRISTR